MKPWGKSISLDLYECDINTINNPESLKTYIKEIISEINMKAHGPTYVERFGTGDLEGYSAMQFIETSSITIHADEPEFRCFIDVFSCKDFDEAHVEEFSKKFFGAQRSRAMTLMR